MKSIKIILMGILSVLVGIVLLLVLDTREALSVYISWFFIAAGIIVSVITCFKSSD